jgi:ADP-ribosylglycohydrolase
VAGADLSTGVRGGLLGVAVGEALGLPWAGAAPRTIKRQRLLDDVGPTGPVTAAVLAAAGVDDDAGTRDGAAASDRLARGLVAGWRAPEPAARRAAALPLGVGAVVVADLAARALDGQALYQLVTDHADDWPPPFHGVGAEDRAVLDALLAVLHRHDDPSEGMRAAVRLGGDGAPLLTALVGGILGCRRPTAIDRVAWRDRVALPDEASMASAVATLTA